MWNALVGQRNAPHYPVGVILFSSSLWVHSFLLLCRSSAGAVLFHKLIRRRPHHKARSSAFTWKVCELVGKLSMEKKNVFTYRNDACQDSAHQACSICIYSAEWVSLSKLETNWITTRFGCHLPSVFWRYRELWWICDWLFSKSSIVQVCLFLIYNKQQTVGLKIPSTPVLYYWKER